MPTYKVVSTVKLANVNWSYAQSQWLHSWQPPKRKSYFNTGRPEKQYDLVKDRVAFMQNAITELLETVALSFNPRCGSGENLIQAYDSSLRFQPVTFKITKTQIAGTMQIESFLEAQQFGELFKKAMKQFKEIFEGYEEFYDDHSIPTPADDEFQDGFDLLNSDGKPAFLGKHIHIFEVLSVLNVGNAMKEYCKCKLCGDTGYRDVKALAA